MRWLLAIFILGLAGAALFSGFLGARSVVVRPAAISSNVSTKPPVAIPSIPEAPQPSSTIIAPTTHGDAPPQAPLANPPAVVKAIYLTGWVAGSPARMANLIKLINTTELNAVVIDIKDYSGYVSYAMDVPGVKASGAEKEIRISHPNTLIKTLHDNGIYVIGRITDFQDPILAKAHPEWALHDRATGAVWEDNHGLAWMDPAAQPVWDYLASIGKDAFARGFDELNFDYIRFASDGALGKISYPFWNMTTPRAKVIAGYFKFLRDTFPTQKISADLFGLATVNSDDLGIGQIIQNAYQYFDYVSPMVYPSHYATGFLGYKYPAAHPYEVIDYSMTHALQKLLVMGLPPAASSTISSTLAVASPPNIARAKAKLRPWLQDFNLGTPGAPGTAYTPAMVAQEKQAVYDSLNTPSSSSYYAGWLMWDAANNYTALDFAPKSPAN